ncbi:MAG: terminase [Gammaproteobacteria bacterium]|nr:terminase [Gammaproteobacteria bacterium]
MTVSYESGHANRTNLIIHLLMVPLFVYGTLRAGWLLLNLHPFRAFPWLFVPLFALAAQGAGHRREKIAPQPFKGVRDFLKRIFAEQFFRFWVFFLSGGWWRNLRSTGP